MKPTRRTFMQSVAAFFSGLFGAEAAAEYVEWLEKPKKVMVPGVKIEPISGQIDLNEAAKLIKEARERYTPYKTKNPKSVRGALRQEVLLGAPGAWRTGNFMGREGTSYGSLLKEAKIPIGCQLGPKAELVDVNEARKTLTFLLAPEHASDWMSRYNLTAGEMPGSAYRGAIQTVRKIPPPKAGLTLEQTMAENFRRDYVDRLAPPHAITLDSCLESLGGLSKGALQEMRRVTLENYGD